jgi:hypothetical protein
VLDHVAHRPQDGPVAEDRVRRVDGQERGLAHGKVPEKLGHAERTAGEGVLEDLDDLLVVVDQVTQVADAVARGRGIR